MPQDYGPLAGVVGTVGSLVAAGVAIALAWRGRSKWEPSETDINNGPQKVGGLLTAVLIGALWAVTRADGSAAILAALAIVLGIATLAALLGYGYVTSTQTYDDARQARKIIGGFKLEPNARQSIRRRKITVQHYFAGVDYDVDQVWPRPSRAMAKQVFTALYIALVVFGGVAIATTAIAIEKAAPAALGGPASSNGTTPGASTPGGETSSAGASSTLSANASPIVSARTLRWVDDPDGSVLDGGIYEPGKEIWLQELFPGQPPTAFHVREAIDSQWPKEVRDAIAALAPPRFAPRVDGFRAVSDSAWKLPAPWSGALARTFTFIDENPDGAAPRSGSITSGLANLAVASGSGCTEPNADGVLSMDGGGDCVSLNVTASVDPTFQVTVLAPGAEGPNDLMAGVRSWLDGLEAEVASTAPNVKFSADSAFNAFVQQNQAFLPEQLPDDWQVGPDLDAIEVAPGTDGQLQMTVSAQSGGSALFAVMLTDSTGKSVLSPFLPVTVQGNTTPTVTIRQPPDDLVGDQRLTYSVGGSGFFVDLDLTAEANDPEDGRLTGDSISWTASRNGEGSVEVGTGETVRVRLEATSCEAGAAYSITVTATDSQGANDVTSRQVEIGPMAACEASPDGAPTVAPTDEVIPTEPPPN